MKQVLITGITGLVGSAFATALLARDKDIEIIALVRQGIGNTDAESRVRETILEQCEFDGNPDFAEAALARIKVVEGCIGDPVLLESAGFNGVNVIFHCAADVNLGKDPEGKTFNNNYLGTKNMLALAEKLQVEAFHYVSTAYVAGTLQGTAIEDGLPAEDFHNSYEKSKFFAEGLVRDSGIPFTIYRPSIVVGRLSDGRIRRPLAFYRLLDFLVKLKKHTCSKVESDPSDWLEMPLRLEAFASDKVYFAPVDFVQESIVKLFAIPVNNTTYHITGNSPVTTKWIEDVVSRTLKVKGVTVKAKVENPTMDEKLVTRFLGDLLPYFSSQAVFDQKNIIAALGEKVIDWQIGVAGLEKLIGGYYRHTYPEIMG